MPRQSLQTRKIAVFSNNKVHLLVASAVAIVTVLLYLKTLGNGFVNIDDPDYVLNNRLIGHFDLHMIASAFTEAHVGWWMPLTWISFAIDYQFWKLNPLGYHLTNILLHAVNAGLVALITGQILKLGFKAGKQDAPLCGHFITMLLAGLLWGIHPLRVESVAWVTERKDVLNGLFSLGAILSYLDYVDLKERAARGAGRAYLLSLVFFALSLMAKSVSVVLPLMFLVSDWYPLERLCQRNLRRIVAEKLPFLALSTLMTIATVYFTSQNQYLVTYDAFPFSQRLLVSGNAIFEYCRLFLLPWGIIAFYVIPDPIPLSYAVTSLVVLALSVVTYAFRKHRWLPATWLLFVIPLLPVLAFLQNGDQSFAARFTYLPSVAPSIVTAVFIGITYQRAVAVGRSVNQVGMAVAVAGVFLVWGGGTVKLIDTWKDTASYWSRIIDLQPGAIVYKERGLFYYSIGNYQAAVDDLSMALRMAPEIWRPYRYNLYAYRGEALRLAGYYAESVQDFSVAIAQYPRPAYFHSRGLAQQQLGKIREAEEDFRVAGPDPGSFGWYWIASDK